MRIPRFKVIKSSFKFKTDDESERRGLIDLKLMIMMIKEK